VDAEVDVADQVLSVRPQKFSGSIFAACSDRDC